MPGKEVEVELDSLPPIDDNDAPEDDEVSSIGSLSSISIASSVRYFTKASQAPKKPSPFRPPGRSIPSPIPITPQVSVTGPSDFEKLADTHGPPNFDIEDPIIFFSTPAGSYSPPCPPCFQSANIAETPAQALNPFYTPVLSDTFSSSPTQRLPDPPSESPLPSSAFQVPRNPRKRLRRRSPRRSLTRSADPLPRYTKTLVKQQFPTRDLETLSSMIEQEEEKKHS
jgi:hypothetical protein